MANHNNDKVANTILKENLRDSLDTVRSRQYMLFDWTEMVLPLLSENVANQSNGAEDTRYDIKGLMRQSI
jgi:hypothetical protein